MVTLLRSQGLTFFDLITGHHIVKRLDELSRTQWLSADELHALEMGRLQSLLEYAYRYVPYYRRTFDQVGFHPRDFTHDPESFRQIPIVTKEDMGKDVEEFKTTDPARRKAMRRSATSGSTGEPFVFWEDCYFQDYSNANTLRHHMWCGWRPGEARVYFWGVPFVTSCKQRLRDSIRDLTWHRYFVNAFNLSHDTMCQLATLIRRHKPRLLHGYVSAIYYFTQFLREQGWDDVKIPAVYTSAEIIYPEQRRYIEETLSCRVFNRYATHEVGGIACECEAHGDLHISTETNYVEVLNENNQPVENGQTGNVVVTNLTNYSFPFIRYRLEDISRISTQRCSCGREQPMLGVIQGRHNDMFRTADGRRVLWGIDKPFKTMAGVRKFQFVQKSLDHVVVRVVKNGPLNSLQRAEVEETLKAALGNQVRIDFEMLDDIPSARSGKYRYTICEVE